MHRTYKPILPTHSKLLQQRWDSAYYEEHRRRVASASSTVDTRPPKTYMHLHLKLKRLQVEEERLAVIERDNRTLLTKMSIIMKTNGGVDNQNDCEYKSLNREKRLRELLRSTKENEEMMKRISSKKPQYDHTQWDRDWVANQQHMDQISAYPRDWWKEDGGQSRTTSASTSRRSKSSQRKSTASSRSRMQSTNSQRNKSAAKSDRSSSAGQPASKPHPAQGHQDSKSPPGKDQPDQTASKPHPAQGRQDSKSPTGKAHQDQAASKPHPAQGHKDSKSPPGKDQPDQAASKPHPAQGHQDSKSSPGKDHQDSTPATKPASTQPVKSSVGQQESAKKY